ncbi:MAG: undecaprenyldiphospho-muramoylpentapeptide beta-N-acetylglucosaminyltransferase [Pirellulales bacterium]|nr:undecaprenyldiphospho-muramoylpentapeptide beta-N-acetylglucosaminyltransferase [Pirellulales bacterium]
MNADALHIVFAGGGTGGHLYPGLAVAERIRALAPGARVTFVGSGKPFEKKHVGAARFDYQTVASRPSPRNPIQMPGFLWTHFRSAQQARRFLREEKVDVVVGLGGYVSVPTGRAARAENIPLVLLEQNVVPGRATRWLARSAQIVCVPFEATAARLGFLKQIHVTGTPIRPGFSACKNGKSRRLLILGGSGGARAINQSAPRAIYRIRSKLEGWKIAHQSGEADLEATRSLYGKFGLPATVVPFVRNMPHVLSRTDVAVCRAGGSTLAELAAAGVPAVLLPYPHATDDHQQANAELFRTRGGCPVIDQRDTEAPLEDRLAKHLADLVDSPGRRERIAYTLGLLAEPEAAQRVARLILGLVSADQTPLPPVMRNVPPPHALGPVVRGAWPASPVAEPH